MPKKTPHYPVGMAKQVPLSEWVSQYQAAKELDVHIFRIGVLITNDHLVPAENDAREMGVTRGSLEAEKTWRAQASLTKKGFRLLKDFLKNISF